jgi:Domain of unknown function (DUF4062)
MAVIRTPDQRVRVFVSSTLGELAVEGAAVCEAVARLHLAPVLFEAAPGRIQQPSIIVCRVVRDFLICFRTTSASEPHLLPNHN